MAHGPLPKPASQRARRNKDTTLPLVLHVEPTGQPQLPPSYSHGEKLRPWPERTVQWWQMWRDTPLSAGFTVTDWSELLDTAVIHARFWNGDQRMAAELRQRVANFGATPADRARLRITFAQADEADARRPISVPFDPEDDVIVLRSVGA